MSQIAFQYANAENLLGHSDEVIRFTNAWIPFYEVRGESLNFPSLKRRELLRF